MDGIIDTQTLKEAKDLLILGASIFASLWSFVRARRARRNIVQTTGTHHPQIRWVLLTAAFASTALYCGIITSARHISSLDNQQHVRVIGVVTRLTSGGDQAVARVRDLTGEIPVLFESHIPQEHDLVYVQGRIAVTSETQSPYVKADESTIALSLPASSQP